MPAPALKAKVAVEKIKGHRASSEIARMFGVHPNLVIGWKKHALEASPELFAPQEGGKSAENNGEKEELYRQIGQMKVELDFLKRRVGLLQ